MDYIRKHLAQVIRKAQPDVSDVHQNSALTDISVAYLQDRNNFVSDKVFPIVPVDKQSDVYFKLTKGNFRRNQAGVRAPGTESVGGGFDVTKNSTYNAAVYAFHMDVPLQVRANADFDIEAAAAEYVTEVLQIQREVNWASEMFTTGVWATDKVGTTDFVKWDDGSSDPEADIDAGKSKILTATGRMPNTLVVDYNTHLALKRHPVIQDRFHFTTSESITETLIAKFFEVERYLVAKASYNTAEEGATDVDALVMGKNALLAYVAPRPGLMTPSAGYTFAWRGLTGNNDLGIAISRIDAPLLKATRIEAELAYDHQVVGSDLGYFFSNTVA